MKKRIYVASSWRNPYQPQVVEMLRALGHEVYDFRNPPKRTGFSWSQVDPNWQNWTTEQYREALNHPTSIAGFHSDFDGMQWADTCVMVLPCGRSANTEAGWMKGAGKEAYVLSPIAQEPELMYKIYDGVFATIEELHDHFSQIVISAKDAQALAAKAEKWDKLDTEIGMFYDAENPKGDLCDIGETAARAFGYL